MKNHNKRKFRHICRVLFVLTISDMCRQ